MKKTTYHIPAGKFKAQCLKIMDAVNEHHIPYTITKHGKPIAMLVPIEEKPLDTFGCLKNSIVIHKDIIKPIDSAWESNE